MAKRLNLMEKLICDFAFFFFYSLSKSAELLL